MTGDDSQQIINATLGFGDRYAEITACQVHTADRYPRSRDVNDWEVVLGVLDLRLVSV